MKAVMSLWTAPTRFSLEYSQILIHTLSLLFIKKHFKKTEFITDSKGYNIAKKMGWEYDNVSLLFDDQNLFIDKENIWALGKILSCLTMREPFLHIDNDVLLLKPLPDEILKADIVTQSVDYPVLYSSYVILNILKAIKLDNPKNKYNCGIMGGNDVTFWNHWAWKAVYIANRCREFRNDPVYHDTYVSMCVEQVSLGTYAEEKKRTVTTLLSENIEEDAEAKGYVHYIGAKKSPKWIAATENIFRSLFPEEFKDFQERWKKISL